MDKNQVDVDLTIVFIRKLNIVLCVFLLYPLFFFSGGGRAQALRSKCKIYKVDFTEWMSFLPSNLI